MPNIAVVGASPDRAKFGNKCVRAYHLAGYDVYPVHPTATQIEELKAYPLVDQIPQSHLDRVSLYLPPAVAVKLVATLDPTRVGELWLNPGVDTPEVIEAATQQGLKSITACSIVAIGYSPSQFPDS